ncbi:MULTISPECIES: DUF4169 family protein [unclassified Ruegeria]|uniref:DUF4169 family protein n=1 Tax=unclassified Ruegeria TaxID=2625375 RepID=UPI001488C716|nr:MULTISPECIES: DUF4169 family protein [unclassified Ruegeria]NOD63250.1 DUF4169 family protein [Ruegeria sp. HKCCD6109]NOD75498.1 DUF4169 family protein [Ruegeria sp. HKCCD4332]NOD87480.1 DUF4169 family protein [Ruegeria sp. HKCCD4318]NOD91578.1 DUF4169 family protein [Ruegeria sp. HKCCD4884]NOE13035.1 DUF4169 family protein [Ruegeria sp. HKCCD4318-2]
MGKPVNLNRYRKEKARAEKKARADQNAVAFGRTKAEKEIAKFEQDKLKRDLDKRELDE